MTNSDDAIRKDVNEATTAATTTTGSVAVNPDPPVDDVDGGDIIEHYTLDLIAMVFWIGRGNENDSDAIA